MALTIQDAMAETPLARKAARRWSRRRERSRTTRSGAS